MAVAKSDDRDLRSYWWTRFIPQVWSHGEEDNGSSRDIIPLQCSQIPFLELLEPTHSSYVSRYFSTGDTFMRAGEWENVAIISNALALSLKSQVVSIESQPINTSYY